MQYVTQYVLQSDSESESHKKTIIYYYYLFAIKNTHNHEIYM